MVGDGWVTDSGGILHVDFVVETELLVIGDSEDELAAGKIYHTLDDFSESGGYQYLSDGIAACREKGVRER